MIVVFAAALAAEAGPDDAGRTGPKDARASQTRPDGRRPGREPGNGRGAGGRRPEGSDGAGRGGGYNRHRTVRLTEKQEAELLEHLAKHQPRIFKRLAELRGKDERNYRFSLGWAWRFYSHLKELPEQLRSKVLAKEEARRRIYHLLTDIHEAKTDAEKKRLVGELRAPVTVMFGAEQAEREHRLTQLAEEIERVRAELKARLARRDEIIAERIELLLKGPPAEPSRGPGPPATRTDRGDGAAGATSGKTSPTAQGPGHGPDGRGPSRGPGPPGGPGRPDGPDGPGAYGRGGPYRHRFARLTKEEEAELLKHLAQHQPEISKHLDGLREKDERTYRYWLSRAWGSYQRLKSLPEDIRRSVYAKEKAGREIHRLLGAIRQAKSRAEKKRLVAQLRQPVTAQFDAEQVERAYRLTLLAKEIERVRGELKARTARRDQIIDERIERLVEMSAHMGRHGPKPSPEKPRPPSAPPAKGPE